MRKSEGSLDNLGGGGGFGRENSDILHKSPETPQPDAMDPDETDNETAVQQATERLLRDMRIRTEERAKLNAIRKKFGIPAQHISHGERMAKVNADMKAAKADRFIKKEHAAVADAIPEVNPNLTHAERLAKVTQEVSTARAAAQAEKQRQDEEAEFEEKYAAAHYRASVQEKVENQKWDEAIKSAHQREGYSRTPETFLQTLEKRINALEGSLSPNEMNGLRQSFAELQRSEKQVKTPDQAQSKSDFGDETFVTKSHTEELDHAKDLLQYVEDRENEQRQQETRRNHLNQFDLSVPTTQKPTPSKWDRFKNWLAS